MENEQRAPSVSAEDMEFIEMLVGIGAVSRLPAEEMFIQHGDTTCLKHSIAVAYYSYRLAKKLGFVRFRIYELVRGAILHDYFLYDWHFTRPKNGLHGFSHPYTAFCNALGDFELTEVETDIIVKHMFPLTPIFPRFKESVIVSLMDKICSLYEVFGRDTYKNEVIRLAHESLKARAHVALASNEEN